MAKDVLITPASAEIKWSDTGTTKATITEVNGDIVIDPVSGNLVIGDGSPANIEVGNSSVSVSFTFLGGGQLSSDSNQLSIGISGDTVNLNVTGVTYNWPSSLVTTSDYTASDILTKIKTVDGAGSGLDADLLDGQQGSYYLDWTNVTNKPDPVVTVTLTGDVTGSGNATLTDLANGTISFATTIATNSVALGTDTTGNYVAGLTGGTGVTISGTAGEGWSPTVAIGQAVGTSDNVQFANLTVSGNLTINGTTTTVNATTVTLDDPIITLGGDTAPSLDDNKDRGVEFRWHNGTAAKVGFFGFDDSTGYLTFIPDATNTSEVFSGTQGDIQATNFRGGLIAGDNVKAIFGAGSDLQIYHDGSNSFISDQGTGHIKILANDFRVVNAGNTEQMITADQNGAVTLYYDSVSKLATTSIGVDVTGTAIIKSGNELRLNRPDDGTYGAISHGASGTGIVYNDLNGDGHHWQFAGSEKMRIDSSGSVGIGTSSPASILHLLGTDPKITLGVSGAAERAYLQYDNTASLLTLDSDGSTRFSTNNTERLRIDSSGRVGIGTSSPALPLDVVANSGANALSLRTRSANDYSFLSFRSNDGTEDLGGPAIYRSAASTSNLLFYTANGGAAAERMRIDSSGNVGIGTTTPGTPLDVNGTARATQFRLASTGVIDDATATTTATTQVAIDAFSATAYGGSKVIIEAKTGSNRHITELLVTHNGTTAIATEYGAVYTSGVLATYDVDISSGNVRILATPASATSTSFKVMRTTMFA